MAARRIDHQLDRVLTSRDLHTRDGQDVGDLADQTVHQAGDVSRQVSAEQVYLATHRIRRRIEEEIESLQAQLSEGVPGLVQY